MDSSRLLEQGLKPCECGCNELIPQFDNRGRPHFFISGHNVRLDRINRNWKGGHVSKGYRKIGRQGLEHRLIWESYYKACLLPWGDVHHKNGDKKDNRIENLEAMTHSKHTLLTWKKRKSERFKSIEKT